MNYRLIALDLDGTLLNSRKVITPRTREALRAARERGIVTVIATGRTPQSARRISAEIGGGPVISCNGAAILDEAGAAIATWGIPRAPLQRVLSLATGAGLLVECYTPEGMFLDRPLAQAKAYLSWVRPGMGLGRSLMDLARVWRVNRIRPVPNLARWAEREQLPTVLKVMAIGGREQLGPLAEQIRRELPGLEVTSSGSDNLEVTAAGISKGSSLAHLGARLKIPRQAIIAVGDSDNDLEMLRYAGLGVAMGNASESVRAAASRVTATCDEDGVAAIIEELCLS